MLCQLHVFYQLKCLKVVQYLRVSNTRNKTSENLDEKKSHCKFSKGCFEEADSYGGLSQLGGFL